MKIPALLVVTIAPTLLLALAVVLAAFATIVLDHDILGRDADGWPVLYKTPVLRHAVDALHFAVMFAVPPALAVSFRALGLRLRASAPWIIVGGLLVCAAGSFPVIEAMWTGVKGTSGLRIALVDDPAVALARLGASLAIYAAALLLLGRAPRAGTA